MNFRQIDESPKTFILIFKTGDELAEDLRQFAKEQKLSAAGFKAVGALSSVRFGWFSWESKRSESSAWQFFRIIGNSSVKRCEAWLLDWLRSNRTARPVGVHFSA